MSALRKLPREFYLRSALQVARDLLGTLLVRRIGKNQFSGKIVEVEAYRQTDPASHSFRGRTRRNEVMFQEGGHLYVYFTYGMHFCSNVVTGKEGNGEAVLIRAVEPIEGIERMMENRGFDVDRKDLQNLTNGPAKVCQAFGFGRAQNGIDLLGDEIFLVGRSKRDHFDVCRSSRIGIQNGIEKKWRFFIKGNLWVSK